MSDYQSMRSKSPESARCDGNAQGSHSRESMKGRGKGTCRTRGQAPQGHGIGRQEGTAGIDKNLVLRMV
jgi:hypothetical protein